MINENLWLIPAIILITIAMGWLALSKPTHWKQVDIGSPAIKRLRTAGSISLILSAACCLQADHASMAVLAWCMLIAAASFAIGITLSIKPEYLRRLTFRWLSPHTFVER